MEAIALQPVDALTVTTHALAARFPEAFIQSSVGTRLEFAATGASTPDHYPHAPA